jgi:hypothetical protein
MRKFGILYIPIFVSILFIACQSGYDITRQTIPGNCNVYKMKSTLPLACDDNSSKVYLNTEWIKCIKQQTAFFSINADYYRLVIKLVSDNKDKLIHIKDGQSLTLVIDGERVDLSSYSILDEDIFPPDDSKPKINTNPGWEIYEEYGKFCERAWYDTDLDTLVKIVVAKKVDLLIFGNDDLFVESHLLPEHQENLKKFLYYIQDKRSGAIIPVPHIRTNK